MSINKGNKGNQTKQQNVASTQMVAQTVKQPPQEEKKRVSSFAKPVKSTIANLSYSKHKSNYFKIDLRDMVQQIYVYSFEVAGRAEAL